MINLGKITKFGKEIILEKQDNGCIKCLSHCTDKDGYVRIRYKGKHDRLFRVLYQKKYGAISKGLVLRHLCNNAWCVNIEHLKVGTQKENYQDMVDCGRSREGKQNIKIRGKNNPANKLEEEDVKEIYLSNLGCTTLSKKYNVSKTNIRYIKNKIQWQWLTDTLD
jgi:hypothetical protein